jgi:hypothetical protein
VRIRTRPADVVILRPKLGEPTMTTSLTDRAVQRVVVSSAVSWRCSSSPMQATPQPRGTVTPTSTSYVGPNPKLGYQEE